MSSESPFPRAHCHHGHHIARGSRFRRRPRRSERGWLLTRPSLLSRLARSGACLFVAPVAAAGCSTHSTSDGVRSHFTFVPSYYRRICGWSCKASTEPQPMTPNHALQRTAPRVTARAFCERRGSYIWASVVRSTVGHAPRHAPPSLSLGSLGVATHIVKTSLFSLLLCAVIVGCAHHPTPTQTGFTPPWHVVSTRVAALVDQHASRSAFESYRESSRPAERLRTFSAVEHLTSSRHYSAAERAEHRAWFRSASSVWYYTFECQYSGILFTDASGHVRHALLFG